MYERKFSIVSKAPMLVGECPLWDPNSSSLYWIDIIARQVHRFNFVNQLCTIWDCPSEPGCICLRKCGGLIVPMRSHIAILDTDSGSFSKLIDSPYDTSALRFNDCRCDAYGRLWIGTLVDSRKSKEGRLYSFTKGYLS